MNDIILKKMILNEIFEIFGKKKIPTKFEKREQPNPDTHKPDGSPQSEQYKTNRVNAKPIEDLAHELFDAHAPHKNWIDVARLVQKKIKEAEFKAVEKERDSIKKNG